MTTFNKPKLHVLVFAWLNIVSQVFLPLSVAFTPMVGGAAAQQSAERPASRTTKVHTIEPGETTVSIAAQYGITLEELRILNLFRPFERGFDGLLPGDELNVPVQKRALDAKGAQGEEEQQRIASMASTAGGVLSSSDGRGAAASIAAGAVNEAAQSWMGRFGTAKVNLSVDGQASLAGSSLDWLLPLYDSPEDMLFTQVGVRNKDGRDTVNLGWGLRWLTPSWMYGFNNFFDYDLTGNNRRAGLGGEARTDNLQLSSNIYFRLNNWHQSRDLEDYDERPASGFDVRAQGWLPKYPQLGGKLTYEQYYGDETALFGRESRQRNPYAVTTGVSWTPFPLLTFGVDERLGKGGKNETSFNLQLTWRPGEPISSQLSSGVVGATRLLQASRYDLVDRNNDIVLEYRKQEPVSIKVDDYDLSLPAESSYYSKVSVL